ncbi:hypothetical protein F4809DRAFT_622654 [Biscogniauxia mediterranea]|nr:hypothetical protein F4809DRAFT_622654 [Biscogniauxia mediterranea]
MIYHLKENITLICKLGHHSIEALFTTSSPEKIARVAGPLPFTFLQQPLSNFICCSCFARSERALQFQPVMGLLLRLATTQRSEEHGDDNNTPSEYVVAWWTVAVVVAWFSAVLLVFWRSVLLPYPACLPSVLYLPYPKRRFLPPPPFPPSPYFQSLYLPRLYRYIYINTY